MDVRQMIDGVRDALTVERVFGEPYERGGTTVLPVARLQGGGGGGQGEDRAKSSGVGGGFGLSARPAGVFVIRDGKVRWEAALDVNKILVGMQVVAVVALLTARSIIETRANRQ